MLIVAQASPAQAEEPEALARQVVSALVAHDFASVQKRLTPEMAKALSDPATLPAAWSHFTEPLGAFKRVASVTAASRAGATVETLHCSFERGPLDVRLVLDAEGRLAGLFFPPVASAWTMPPYAAPDRFEERDVVVGTQALPGKLILPRGKGPFPALVLVHGSGSTDENETVGPISPFHDLAVGLASRGVAVLRYQKRSFARPQGFLPPARFTVREETIDDARAAVALLARTNGIDGKRIFVLGHSLGGMLAPRIADHDPAVAGLVILAGGARPLEDIVVEQMKARGTPEEVKAAEAARVRVRDRTLRPSDDVTFLGTKMPATYFLDLRGYSPADVAARLELPILVLHGDRDIQVALADFERWQRALASRPRARLKRYATLTHLFVEGNGTVEDYEKPAHVAQAVIDEVAGFIKEPPQ
jgi:fermentation-respiration switch protein FrsA (DUF1100 family)